MPQEQIHCKDCAYYEQFGAGRTNLGYCKADPPTILQGSGHKTGAFPIMPHDEWCGAALAKNDFHTQDGLDT